MPGFRRRPPRAVDLGVRGQKSMESSDMKVNIEFTDVISPAILAEIVELLIKNLLHQVTSLRIIIICVI